MRVPGLKLKGDTHVRREHRVFTWSRGGSIKIAFPELKKIVVGHEDGTESTPKERDQGVFPCCV